MSRHQEQPTWAATAICANDLRLSSAASHSLTWPPICRDASATLGLCHATSTGSGTAPSCLIMLSLSPAVSSAFGTRSAMVFSLPACLFGMKTPPGPRLLQAHLCVPAPHDEERDPDQGGGEGHEDAGLDELERPEPVARLIGRERAVAKARHARERGAYLAGRLACSGNAGPAQAADYVPGADAQFGGELAAGQHHALRERPGRALRGQVLGQAVDGGHRGHVVHPHPVR